MTITRPHHPLLGETLDVLMEGDERIVVRLANGAPMQIPRRWTDADGAPDSHAPDQARTFTIDSLRALICVVEGLQQQR